MVARHTPYWHVGSRPRPSRRTWKGTQVSRPAPTGCGSLPLGHDCISSPEVVVSTSVQRAVGGYG